MFDPILKAIGWLLALFYGVLPDPFGLAKQDYALGAELKGELEARLIKVMGFAGRRATSSHPWQEYVASVEHLLCDSYDLVRHGGTGVQFEHSALPEDFPVHRAFIAGGLTATNVGLTVEHLRPFAVDVSSGVEEAPGRKSHALVEAFIRAAKNL